MHLSIICCKSIKHISLLLVFMLSPATGAYADDGGLVWAKAMAGDSFSRGYGITLDGSGNVYITGEFQGTVDFDPGPGIYNVTSKGNIGGDIFVGKLGNNGDFV